MTPQPAPPEIQRAVEQAGQQRQAQQQMIAALQQIIAAPHTTVRIANSISALREEGDNHVLMIATIDGRRHDIVMSPQVMGSIAEAHANSLRKMAQDRAA